MTAVLPSSSFDDKIALSDMDTPIPADMPVPPLWRLFAIPIFMRRVSKGGIILSDDTATAVEWHHQLYKIAAVGKHVYRGQAYKSFDISEDERPKVGDLWLIDPKQPRRFKFRDLSVIVVNDDQLVAKVDPKTIEHLSFYGMSL